MTCQRCGAPTPDVAHYCQSCGLDLRSDDLARRKSFAVKPDEPVASFALISTIMPRGAQQHPQMYKIALVVALVVALLAAIFGAVPIAILVAAFAIPVVYIVYLYDVNLWEDEPVPVTVAAFALTGVLSLLFTIGWTQFRASPVNLQTFDGGLASGPQPGQLLLVAVAVPIIAQVLTQLGPIYLASRPKFDDLMDGFTFGVVSGVAYATFDTLVRHHQALFGGMVASPNAADWTALIFLEGLIKPLIMGTAAGIAAAEFSGLGEGYDGFSLRYLRGVGEAIVANVAYFAGAYLFSFLPGARGLVLTLLWGLLVLGVLILRSRNILHVGLMEAALEHAARSDAEIGPAGDLRFCARCEMPLVAGAAFCNACGTAVRTGERTHAGRSTAASAPPDVESSTSSPPTSSPATSAAPTSAAVTSASSPTGPSPQAHPSSVATPPKRDRHDGDEEGQA